MKSFYFVCLFLFSIACTKHEEVKVEYKEVQTLNRNDTLQIPISLRERLEEDFFLLSPRPVERTVTQKKVLLGTLTREYLPFQAFLMDRQGVLNTESYLFKMDGGGTIDLAQYLNGKMGEFAFGFRMEEKYNSKNTRVYFLNNLKVQTCDDYKDITKFFFSQMAQQGIITTTQSLVHLKLLVGAFVLIANIDDKYYIGQLNITDSRAKTALCR